MNVEEKSLLYGNGTGKIDTQTDNHGAGYRVGFLFIHLAI